jgi:hypothetical protein
MEMMAEIIATQKLIVAEMKADQEERTVWQEASEASPQKMEPNPENMES